MMNNNSLIHNGKVLSVLIPDTQISARVKELGQRISQDYAGKNVLMLGILNGAFMFLSDLVREFTFTDFDVDFVKFHSYQGVESILIICRNSINGDGVRTDRYKG